MSEALSFGIFAKDQASGTFARLSTNIDKTSRSLGGITKAAGVAAVALGAVAAVKLGAFLKDAVGSASDLGETMSKSEAVFGSANKAVLEFAKTSSTAIGQSKNEAIAATSQFGNMFNQLGIGQGKAAGMSIQMTKLASDFASFHNADITEVLEAQQAAFRGEYDSIQRFVPTLSAAAVEQEGLRLKLASSTKELDAQDKAIAVHSLMLSGAGKAAGDFGRTSDGLANQQRILKAQFTDTKAEIGQQLLPVVTRFFGFLNDRGIPAIRGLSELLINGNFTSNMKKAFGAQEDSGFVTFLLKARTTAITVFGEIKGGIIAFASAWKFNDGEITSSGFPGFMEKLGFNARRTFDFFKAEVLPRLLQFAGYVKHTVIPVVAELVSNGFRRLQEILGTVRQAIADNRPQLVQLAGAIRDVAKWIIQDLVPWLDKVGHVTLPFLKTAIKSTADRVGLLVDGFNAVKEPVRKAMAYVWDKVSGFFDNILTGSAKAFGWVPGLGDKLKAASEDFKTFRTDVNRALDGIDDEAIKISTTFQKTQQRPGSAPIVAATGGPIFGSGTGTSDNVPMWGSNGEHMITAREVMGAGGHAAVRATRAMWAKAAGFATGGAVGSAGLNVSNSLPGAGAIRSVTGAIAQQVAKEIAKVRAAMGFNPGLGGVLEFVRSQVGKPYLWGGVGPAGYDCSGLVGAAINVALGRGPHRRLGSTGSMPWSMFAPGPGAFSVGWFKGNPGHTAATVNGTNIESRGGRGVVMGAAARGARNSLFTNLMHVRGFATGGAVGGGDPAFDLLDPRGRAFPGASLLQALKRGVLLRDVGGSVPPGTSLVQNNTGRNETIITEVARLRLNKTIQDLAVGIAKLVHSFGQVRETIGKTVAHIQSLVQQRNEFATATTSSFTGSLFGGGASVGDLKLRMDANTNDARSFQKNLALLKGKSNVFNTGLWNELAASSDYGAAEQLAQMSPAQLLAISKSYISRQQATRSLGMYAGQARYGTQIAEAQMELKRQQITEKAITNVLAKARLRIIALPGGHAYLTAATNG